MFDHILFDLDGTLTDPAEGILRSLRHALGKFDILEEDDEKLRICIGPPLVETFCVLVGPERTDEAIRHYREHHEVAGLMENREIEGIRALLQGLFENGKKLYVATTKLTSFAEKVLEHFNLLSYFSLVIGGNPDGTRTAKSEIIAEILVTIPGVAKEKIVMIGDRKYDMIGAKANGIMTVAVTYGYGSETELRAQKPHYLVRSVDELARLLLS